MPPALASLLLDHPFSDDEPLLHAADQSVTRVQAVAAAADLALELKARGISPRQAVAVCLPNSPDFVIAMMAVWMADAVLVPVNPRLSEDELDSVLSMTQPAAMVKTKGTNRLQGSRHFAPDTAFVLWTSGTTGTPKPILHTHSGYLELLDRVLRPLRGDGAGRAEPGRQPTPNLIPVSLALNAGIYNALFGLRAGAALVIMERFATTSFQHLVHRFAIRSTVLPPAAIVSLNDDIDVADLRPLRFVRSITAPLSPTQAQRFHEKFGVFVLNGYGQAEIGEVIGWTAADARQHPEKLGAVGRPHPGVSIKVQPETGELLVKPPAKASGYASGGELADRVDEEGFVRTGDLASLDDDGFVWLHGRISDMINRGGNKIFPDEVEEVLRQLPGVTDAGVVAAADERLGEIPVAYVVIEGALSDADLETHCRSRLTPYKIPASFRRVAALPRNDAGKLIRRQLGALPQVDCR